MDEELYAMRFAENVILSITYLNSYKPRNSWKCMRNILRRRFKIRLYNVSPLDLSDMLIVQEYLSAKNYFQMEKIQLEQELFK